jgi:hypothetical protein
VQQDPEESFASFDTFCFLFSLTCCQSGPAMFLPDVHDTADEAPVMGFVAFLDFAGKLDCTDESHEYLEILKSDIGNIDLLDCFDSMAFTSHGKSSFEIVDKCDVDHASGWTITSDFVCCINLFLVNKALVAAIPSIVSLGIEDLADLFEKDLVDLADLANVVLLFVFFEAEETIDFCFVVRLI